MSLQTLIKEYTVDKTRIGFIRFIFEAYEGLAVVTTLDPKTGHIKLTISPDQVDIADMVMEDLKKDFYIEQR